MSRFLGFALSSAVAGALLVGCAAQQRGATGRVVESGFITDYSQLVRGGRSEPDAVYRNPEAAPHGYSRVRLRKVNLWRSGEDSFAVIGPADLQRLADALYFSVRLEIEKSWPITDEAVDGMLDVHLALTEVAAGRGVLDVYLTAAPADAQQRPEGALSAEARKFVNAAAMEFEIDDPVSGDVRVAGIDIRSSGRSLRTLETWADVHVVFDVWAQRLTRSLRDSRRGRK